ncbi:(alpha)-aspartyl dipeptidase, partial [Pasteurella multocida subsp. multocida str. Anand1_buffalo]
ANVYALPEGTALHIQGRQARVLGQHDVLLFSENMQLATLPVNSVFDY